VVGNRLDKQNLSDEHELGEDKSSLVAVQIDNAITLKQKIYGMLLFALAMLLYSGMTLIVKVSLTSFGLTPQEVAYYIGLVILPLHYVSSRHYN